MNPETKKKLLFALGVIVLCALSFSAGAFMGPRRVEVVEKEKVVFREMSVEDLTKGMTFAKVVKRDVFHNVVTTITQPVPAANGCPAIPGSTVIVDNTIEKAASDEKKTSDEKKVTTVATDITDDKSKSKITINQPKWAVGVFVGASVVNPWVPIAGPLVVGGEVDYRILGGVSLGLRGNTAGTFGLTGKMEF